ncbi:MAG: excisionase family DNA-binding protein, partial [Anaerolineae bacterium]
DSIVVMMSGYSVEEEIKRAMALGAQDFIAKPFEDIDEIMTIEEVARYLSLHELTVRRLARDGEIPAFKIGRQWRVKKALLDRWIEREAMRNVQERGAQEREEKQ